MPQLLNPDWIPPTQDVPHPPPPAADPPPCGSRLTLAGAPYADGSYACSRVTGHAGVHHDSRSGATWPDVRPGPAPPNPFADDIRQINDWQDIPDDVRQYVTRLADRVERYAAEPAEHTLDAAGLDPEQEIRARALDVAGYVIADVSGTVAGVAQHLIDFAEPLADWIRTGARP